MGQWLYLHWKQLCHFHLYCSSQLGLSLKENLLIREQILSFKRRPFDTPQESKMKSEKKWQKSMDILLYLKCAQQSDTLKNLGNLRLYLKKYLNFTHLYPKPCKLLF